MITSPFLGKEVLGRVYNSNQNNDLIPTLLLKGEGLIGRINFSIIILSTKCNLTSYKAISQNYVDAYATCRDSESFIQIEYLSEEQTNEELRIMRFCKIQILLTFLQSLQNSIRCHRHLEHSSTYCIKNCVCNNSAHCNNCRLAAALRSFIFFI